MAMPNQTRHGAAHQAARRADDVGDPDQAHHADPVAETEALVERHPVQRSRLFRLRKEKPQGCCGKAAHQKHRLNGVGSDDTALTSQGGMQQHAGRNKKVQNFRRRGRRQRREKHMKRHKLRRRHADPGDGNDGAGPLFSRSSCVKTRHLGQRHGGQRTNFGSRDESVQEEADGAYAEPPERGGAGFLSKRTHAERRRAADDGADK